MGWKCAVCPNTSRNTVNLSFFRIPKKKLRAIWLERLNLTEENVTTSTRICSEHFFAGEKLLSQNIPDLSIGKQAGKKSQRIKPNREKNQSSREKPQISEQIIEPETNIPTEPSGDACQITSKNEIDLLQKKIRELETEMEKTKLLNSVLLKEKSNLEGNKLRYENIKNNPTKIRDLTGLPDSQTFETLYELFDKPKQYWSYQRKGIDGQLGRHRKLSPQDELVMYILRLRQDLSETVLSAIFDVSVSPVSCILSTWACHINAVFSHINMEPTKKELQELCPPNLLKKFPNCVMILDCTEFEVDEPNELDKQSVFWSEYWSRHTAKALVGCTLWGSLSFVSDLFPGSTSDVEMCEKSGLLSKIKAGEVYMADKGFTAQRQFEEKGAKLIVPPFANRNKKQFNPQQVEKTKHIASTRIFIEQAIGRIKSYRYLTRRISISCFQLASINFKNIAYLTNFQRSFVTDADPVLTARRQSQIEIFCNRLLRDTEDKSTESDCSSQNDNDLTEILHTIDDPDIEVTDVRTYDDELVRGLVDLLTDGDVDVDVDFDEISEMI